MKNQPKLPKIKFTKSGVAELKKELSNLETERPKIVKDLKKAREMGDLSENGFYKAARAKLSSTDSRISRLKYLIKCADVIEPHNNTEVEFGNLVIFNMNGREFKYKIVGKYEANPRENKISYISPLGKSLLGSKVGEKIKFMAPSGEREIAIKGITS